MLFEDFYTSVEVLPNRYISPQGLEKYLQKNLSDYISIIGHSYLGKPIYKLSLGSGPTRVIGWSQMHGNESNSTHAILDMLRTLDESPTLRDELFQEVTLDFILMLNPDGSKLWQRRNSLEIDLNRDYHKLSSIEFPILKDIVTKGNYNYALNLHEQRTIFSSDGVHPATLSFLSPSQNASRDITSTRKKAMAVIALINDKMQDLIPNHIARYSDEFYPNSTGDNFTALGIPTILYEGGHYKDDYLRKKTREYYTIALYYGLKAIGELKGSERGYETYDLIPKNRESHYDIIYRNVKLNTDYNCVVDIAVQYKEIINEGEDEISFVPIVIEVGDLSRKKGWKEIDATGKYFQCPRKFPKMDQKVDFEILDQAPLDTI